MKVRQLLLRIMLWSLGFAALTGVGAILLQTGDLTWRVVGTGLVTAAAAGLLMACSKMVDREKTRLAGLLGMCGIIVEFVMALLMIWEVIEALFGMSVVERVGLTMLHMGLCAVPAIGFLARTRSPRTLWTSRVGPAICLAVFALLMLGTWLPTQWPRFEDKWWQTAGVLAIYGPLATLCLIDFGTPNHRSWRWAGILAALFASIMWLVGIWTGSSSDLEWVIITALSSASVVLAHASLAVLCPLPPSQRWVLWGTVGSAIVTAGVITFLVFGDLLLNRRWENVEFLSRCAGAGGILTGCGTLALVVLAVLNRQIDYEPGSLEMLSLFLACPRCGKKQNVAIGDANCVACDLRISTRIEEPRCRECGYLLYKLTSDRCPECGEAVASKP